MHSFELCALLAEHGKADVMGYGREGINVHWVLGRLEKFENNWSEQTASWCEANWWMLEHPMILWKCKVAEEGIQDSLGWQSHVIL